MHRLGNSSKELIWYTRHIRLQVHRGDLSQVTRNSVLVPHYCLLRSRSQSLCQLFFRNLLATHTWSAESSLNQPKGSIKGSRIFPVYRCCENNLVRQPLHSSHYCLGEVVHRCCVLAVLYVDKINRSPPITLLSVETHLLKFLVAEVMIYGEDFTQWTDTA